MKSKKRDRLEVIYDILNIINEHHNSIKPTRLLRCANLSSKGFAEYFDELKEKGFIKEVTNSDEKRYITLTDKGFAFLQKYKVIMDFIDEFNL